MYPYPPRCTFNSQPSLLIRQMDVDAKIDCCAMNSCEIRKTKQGQWASSDWTKHGHAAVKSVILRAKDRFTLWIIGTALTSQRTFLHSYPATKPKLMTHLSSVKSVLLVLILITTFAYSQPSKDRHRIQDLGQPSITNFSPKTYRAHPNNYDVVQDKNGTLYFGNLWGVLQFDGTLWRNILLPKGASCTSLAISKQGIIYVGGRNSIGFLTIDSIGTRHYVSLIDSLPEKDRKFNEIWRIALNDEGVFFASYEKLFFLKHGGQRPIAILDTPWYVFEVLNDIYITTKDGLSIFKDHRIVKVQHSEFYNGKFINAITHLDKKLLISTSEDGFTLFDGKHVVPWDTPLAKVTPRFNPTRVKNIGANLVVTTELNGVYISNLKGEILHHLNKENGLAANTVSGMHFDQSGLLWLTLYNGIAFLPLSKQIRYIGDFAGVTGIPYSAAMYDGKLYLATSEGLFFRSFDADLQSTFVRVPEINGLVWSLKVIDDKLFCGQAITARVIDHGSVASVYHEGTWMFHPSDNPDEIFMGTYSGIHILTKKNGQWKYRTRVRGFYGDARNFTTDRLGDIWIRNDNDGILRLRLSAKKDSITQTKKFTTQHFPIGNGSTVSRMHDDILATSSNGIYRYDNISEQFVTDAKLNKVLAENGFVRINKIVVQQDSLWVINDAGAILKLVIEEDSVRLLMTTTLLNGDLITDFEHLNPIGNIAIVGTLDGFALYNAKYVVDAMVPLQAFVSRVESSGELLSDGNYDHHAIKDPIPYSGNSMKFVFASNSYQDLSTNQYQYYLEGFSGEKQWSVPTSLPFKEYTNLREGKYALHVRTINFENHVSEENVLRFQIEPPGYRSTWAYLIYGMFFIVGNFLFFRYIRRRIEVEKQRVAREEQHNLWLKQKEWDEESLQHQRTLMRLGQEKLAVEEAALREKAELIEREKEKERQIMEMERERLEGDLRHKNNELTSLTLNITQKNELLTKIGSQLNKTIQTTTDDEVSRTLREIKTLLQKGLSADQEWEKFTDHFDIVHQGFLSRLQHQYPDLSSSTLKLCAFIKMRLSSKQIATLMNTAPDSVLKARYRLRMKFNLEKDTGLEEFLNSF